MRKLIYTSRLVGGLGNKLFQIASAYSVAKRDGASYVIDPFDSILAHTPLKNYKKNIFSKLKFSKSPLIVDLYEEKQCLPITQIPKFKHNIKFKGYFASHHYFKRNETIKLFSGDFFSRLYIKMRFRFLNNADVSLHIRRGDYLTDQNMNLLSIDYYHDAIEEMGMDKTYVVFSDDINWCKSNLQFIPKKIFMSQNKDHLDLLTMARFKYHITANSTFSWWASYLSGCPAENIISPNLSRWHKSSFKDLFKANHSCEITKFSDSFFLPKTRLI
jgi:hypothetical protein